MNNRHILLKIFNFFIIFSLVAMVSLVFLNAVLRYLFNSSIPQAEELSRYFFIWTSFLGAISAFKDKQHVGVDLLIQKLKGTSKLLVETIGDFIMLFAFIVMLYGGIAFTKVSALSKGPATGIPFGFISISIIVASISMLLIVIFNMIDRFRKKELKG
jgi:TRAP-type C4-dicarboxylate transport system permease small subunit